jgi:hypothetical protein
MRQPFFCKCGCLVFCVVAAFLFSGLISGVSAQEEGASVNVTFYVGEGGLLWVNGTSVVNASTVNYSNGTVLLLAATPTNANYSYSHMVFNGNVSVTDNPAFLLLVNSGFDAGEDWTFSSDWVSVGDQGVQVFFVAEAVPTPGDLSVDDAAGLAVVFGLLGVMSCVAAVLIFVYFRGKEDER